jgi:hypothetical protein
MRRSRTATALALSAALLCAPAAGAQPPPLPPAPPYVPGSVAPYPGSFSYPYNNIVAPAPATVDARGVNVTAGVDPAMASTGLPGDQLGNSPPVPNSLTSSSAQNGIQAGPTPPGPPNQGVNVGAGPAGATLESPTGTPPSSGPTPEAAAPTTLPGNPLPVLENPGGKPQTSH